jgi:pyruvate kinase
MAVGFNEDTTPEMLRQHKASRHVLEGLVVCLSASGAAASLIAKYRPPCPTVIISSDDQVLRQASLVFGHVPVKVGAVGGGE